MLYIMCMFSIALTYSGAPQRLKSPPYAYIQKTGSYVFPDLIVTQLIDKVQLHYLIKRSLFYRQHETRQAVQKTCFQ